MIHRVLVTKGINRLYPVANDNGYCLCISRRSAELNQPLHLAGSANCFGQRPTGQPLGPIALAGCMGFSFVTVGMAVVSFGQIVEANSDSVAQLGALVMVGFGMVILLPKFSSDLRS